MSSILDMFDIDDTESSCLSKDIAIIGMAGKLPLADNLDEYWMNIISKRDCVRKIPYGREKLMEKYVDKSGKKNVTYKVCAYLDRIDLFDYEFFDVSPREAKLMDPKQRILLETSWNAIEDAGYSPDSLKGERIGVYIGFRADEMFDYRNYLYSIQPDSMVTATAGNLVSILASRISYVFDFCGPSMVIDTACSSSSVAIHEACNAIHNGECTEALVGSVALNIFPIKLNYSLGIESLTSRCQTFDEDANGTGSGEGGIVIMLKSLAQAEQDKDHIYAIIKSSAINQDGKSIGITAPRPDAQADVIINAWQNAGIDPETINYIEAHGTGTQLGDPIEIQGITQAFSKYTHKKQFCGIGSVKTMIGHLDNLAGMAGVVKMVYAMQNNIMPASMHFYRPNSKIDFEDCPVYVNDRNREWNQADGTLRCGISSFGMSGTNSHIVLEKYTANYIKNNDEESCIFVVSAKNEQSLKDLVSEYISFLKSGLENCLQDICYTCSMGRKHFEYRLAILANSIIDLVNKLTKIEQEGLINNIELDLYYANAGRKLTIRGNEIFDNQRQICAEYVNGNTDILEHIYRNKKFRRVRLPGYKFQKLSCWLEPEDNWGENENRGLKVKVDSPVFQGSMLQLAEQFVFFDKIIWDKYWTIRDHKIKNENIMVGTAYIEIFSVCLQTLGVTGNFEICDLILLVPFKITYNEERILQVSFTKRDFGYFVEVSSSNSTDEAVVHAKCQVVVNSNEINEMYNLEMGKENSIKYYNVSQKEDLKENASFVFGERWDNITDVWKGENYILKRCELSEQYKNEITNYMTHPALMDMAVNNVIDIDLADHSDNLELFLPLSYASICIKKMLPAVIYSLVRVNPVESESVMSFNIDLMDESGEILIKIKDYVISKVFRKDIIPSCQFAEYFYKMGWKLSNQISNEIIQNEKIILFCDRKDISCELINLLHENQLIRVYISNEYKKLQNGQYEVSESWEDYSRLCKEIGDVDRVIHMHSLNAYTHTKSIGEVHRNLQYGFYGLLALLKALVNNQNEELKLSIVTRNGFAVEQSDCEIIPENAALASLPHVISSEFENICVNFIDINEQVPLENLISEISTQKNAVVVLRNQSRYVVTIEKEKDININNLNLSFSKDGVYIVTGGMGEIGVRLVQYLVEKKCNNIVLIGRRKFPDASTWNSVTENDVDLNMYQTILKIKGIITEDTRISYFSNDLSDTNRINELFEYIRNKIGPIKGVFHCAGVAGSSYIIRKSLLDLQEVFMPKVDGTWNILQTVKRDALDFVVLFSSTVSLAGGAGQSDYSYANAYMDAYAEISRLQKGNVISINWTAWNDIGMAFRNERQLNGIQLSLSSTEAMDILSIVLNNYRINRLIVGKVNPNFSDMKKHDKVSQTKRQQSYNGIENTIIYIWKQVLGYETMDIHDDFFGIGGDSILLSQVHQKINEIYPDTVTVANLFTYTTIYKLSMFLFEQFNDTTYTQEAGSVMDGSENKSMENEDDSYLFDLLDRFENGDIDIDKAFESLEDYKE